MSLQPTPFRNLVGRALRHRLFFAALVVVGALAVFSLLMADLYRELHMDATDRVGEHSARNTGKISPLRWSAGRGHRESMTPKAPCADGIEAAGGALDHSGRVLNPSESVPIMGSEIVTSPGFDRVQARSEESSITAPASSLHDRDLVTRERRNEPRAPDAFGVSGGGGDASSKEAELSIPLFYTLKESQYTNLPPEQQQAVASLQNEYIDYHHDWTESSQGDISEWNDRMREFHVELVRRVGASAADALTR